MSSAIENMSSSGVGVDVNPIRYEYRLTFSCGLRFVGTYLSHLISLEALESMVGRVFFR